MKNKNYNNLFKSITAFVLALTIFSVIPQYRRCDEKPADQISIHSIIPSPKYLLK